MLSICGFTKTTLLDFPGHLASTVFLGGCNLNCPFCHNHELITAFRTQYLEQDLLALLKKRSHIMEGVCVSGGEPTLYPELPNFIQSIKELGLKVKLDTNGTNPDMIAFLYEHDLVDYVAMDIKNSKELYAKTCGMTTVDLSAIDQSISFLRTSGIPYEFRTTLVKELHSEQSTIDIGNWIAGSGAYYLQNFKNPSGITLPFHSLDLQTMLHYRQLLVDTIPNTMLRGMDT